METATAPTINELLAVSTGEGEHYHFLNHLATVKVAGGDSATGLGAVEFTAPRGFGPPLHVHSEEDEIMYVIDGRIRLDVGDDSVYAETGTVVSLPHGIPHVFQVESTTARFLTVTAGRTASPGFDEFVAALGAPTDLATMPAPVEIDPGHVAQVCAQHGIEVLGPPPPPLD